MVISVPTSQSKNSGNKASMLTFRQFISENSISKHIRDQIPVTMKDEGYKTAREINVGSCFDFAFDVCQRLKANGIKGAKMKRGPGHSWIKYKDKHYDAEHPNGVSHPSKLNYYKRETSDREKLNLRKEFK